MSREPVRVVLCDGQHGKGRWSHSVVAYKGKIICSVDREPGEAPFIHGYFPEPLAEGILCELEVDDDGVPWLYLIGGSANHHVRADFNPAHTEDGWIVS